MNLSDQKLYELCEKYGSQAKIWRQKFIGLLPEVYKRKLYEKKKFGSIFEFAAKLAGISEKQVRLTLNIEKRLEDKPDLNGMLVNGEVSINKLARVVSIATPENDKELAEKIKILPQKALETLVRDEKFAKILQASKTDQTGILSNEFKNQNGLQKPLFNNKSLRTQTSDHQNGCTANDTKPRLFPNSGLKFELSVEIIQQLNELHVQGQDVNGILQKMLTRRREQIKEEKNKISKTIKPTDSRYISVKIKKILKQEYGEKCSIKNCQKPAATLHHTQRFSLSSDHDPNYLAPLCKEHHVIAHSIDQQYQKTRETKH